MSHRQPENLPTTPTDPYAQVDVTRLDLAHAMSPREMIHMGNIAEARGDEVRSMEWKVAAQNTIAREQAKEDNARLEGQAANTYRGRFGKGIVAPTGTAPWHSDPDWLEINTALTKATADDGWKEDAEIRDKVAGLRSSLLIREEAARRAAMDAGHWTVADENMARANQSLHEKAAQVAAQVEQGS